MKAHNLQSIGVNHEVKVEELDFIVGGSGSTQHIASPRFNDNVSTNPSKPGEKIVPVFGEEFKTMKNTILLGTSN